MSLLILLNKWSICSKDKYIYIFLSKGWVLGNSTVCCLRRIEEKLWFQTIAKHRIARKLSCSLNLPLFATINFGNGLY